MNLTTLFNWFNITNAPCQINSKSHLYFTNDLCEMNAEKEDSKYNIDQQP